MNHVELPPRYEIVLFEHAMNIEVNLIFTFKKSSFAWLFQALSAIGSEVLVKGSGFFIKSDMSHMNTSFRCPRRKRMHESIW